MLSAIGLRRHRCFNQKISACIAPYTQLFADPWPMRNLLKLIILTGLLTATAHADNRQAIEKSLPTLGEEINTPSTIVANALAKDAVCTRCHDESEAKPILAIYQTPHGNKADSRTPSCQSCHGESAKHLSGAAGGARPLPDVVFGDIAGERPSSEPSIQNLACLACHRTDPSRTHWQGGAHQAANLACSSCHQTHAAHDNVRDKRTQPDVCFGCHQEQRAQAHKFSHHPITEAKVACSECHNPHGSAGPKLLIQNTVNETCFVCHAEKRGPFLWEHQPVSEDCSNCHTPHGSNITPLLKSRPPFLCQECHDGPHNSKNPVAENAGGIQGGLTGSPANPSTSYTGRACMNCHGLVHGSNHPAGALLQR